MKSFDKAKQWVKDHKEGIFVTVISGLAGGVTALVAFDAGFKEGRKLACIATAAGYVYDKNKLAGIIEQDISKLDRRQIENLRMLGEKALK